VAAAQPTRLQLLDLHDADTGQIHPDIMFNLAGGPLPDFLGAWDGATAYILNNVVEHDDGGVPLYYFICILAHTNHVPPNATYWHRCEKVPT
jgi:hypothetical protein